MADYRCPKHDLIFSSVVDHRVPGSPAKDPFPAHPVNGHPDCPHCQNDPVNAPSKADIAKLAQHRANELAAAANKAAAAAQAAAAEAAAAEAAA